MSRPGFVLEVDSSTPPLLTTSGAEFRQERFGVGSKVVYPADAVASSDPITLIDAALTAPVEAPPLASRLTAQTKLTIVLIDCALPLPRPHYDVRRPIMERVLETAARAGVDDVEIVVAGGLQRRWSPAQVTSVLGDRIASSFLPDGLITSHDVLAEDLVEIGEVDGAAVRINRRVAESDLVVVIEVRASHTNQPPLATALTGIETVNQLAGVDAASGHAAEVCALIGRAAPLFSVSAVLGQPLPSRSLRFASKREWEWGLGDRLALAASRQIVAALPRQGAQLVHGNPRADYAVIDVIAGADDVVFENSRQVWCAANVVEVPAQADVLVASVWGASIDEGDPIGSPLDAAHRALVVEGGSHLGTPFVREGGVLIAFHPLRDRFSNRRQSAAADFFSTVLPHSLEPREIAVRFEGKAITDEWYLDLYRKQFAPHPLHVYHQWYEIAEATSHYSDVIWVGGDRRSAALLGHRAATTYADALEIAANSVGHAPAITVLRGPGLALGAVG